MKMGRIPARTRALGIAALAVLGSATIGTAVAAADGPGSGTPWVVSVGDSYISGEGGRWAGNTNNSYTEVDALGPTAYYDNATNTAELIPRCHRSHSAEVYIGGGVNGENLACSGAQTSTFTDSSGNFKPGIDFYSQGSNQGQALMLENFAMTHNVKTVAISIGGNNFNFAGIVTTCVEDFLDSPSWWPTYCSQDSSVTGEISSSNVANQTTNIENAIINVAWAMYYAGYSYSQYSVVVQDYPSPIPNGSGFRYSESGYTRQSTGGCGFWNADANWANSTLLPTINGAVKNAAAKAGAAGMPNIKVMELQSAFNGHRLCENTVGLLEEEGLSSWTQSGAVDRSEWFDQVRTASTAGSSPYYLQEDLHPDYWAQLGLRSCLRQAYNGGAVRGGTCSIAGTGLTSLREPNMTLH